jgi:hypothetical protein
VPESVKQLKQSQKSNQKQQQKLHLSIASNPNLSARSDDTDRHSHYYNAPGSETERVRQCGNLFDRRSTIAQEIVDEFFRRQPCLYDQNVYKNSARIFNCLKADLNENPILKSLKQQQMRERGIDPEQQELQVTDIPKLEYKSENEKKSTLQLSFLTLKCKFITFS